MSAPEIRPTLEADLPAITAIYQQAVREGTATFELEPPDLTEMTRRYRTLIDGGYPYFVAILDGRVAGYAYAGAYRPRPAYRFSAEDSIYLHPDAAGQGLGKQLLAALAAQAEAAGIRKLIAVIGDSANAGSVGVHRVCGFRPAGAIHSCGWKFDRWLDIVLMERTVGPGDTAPPPQE